MKKIKTYLVGVYSMLLLFSCVKDQDFNQFTPDGSIAATDVQEAINELKDEVDVGGGGNEYEILVTTDSWADVQTALDGAGTTPVRITNDITDINTIQLIDTGQTLIFEGVTLWTGTTMPPNSAIIENKNVVDSLITIIGGTIDGTNEGVSTQEYNGVKFDSVYNSTIKNITLNNVLTRTGSAQGNIDVRSSHYITIENIRSYNTEKSGIFILDGSHITVKGGFIYGSGDSGLIGVDSPYGVVDGIHVDACGYLDSSNITMNMRYGKFINNKSTNGVGPTNGWGFTLGHPAPYSAWNTIVSGNTFEGNATAGILMQGASTEGNIISDNVIINNGVGSLETYAGGIISNNNLSNMITDNTIKDNKNGVSIISGSTGITIQDNEIEDNAIYGINVGNGVNTRIIDNYFDGQPAGGDIVDNGTDTFMAGNEQADGD